jgi:anti-anti-sigma factor
MPRDFRVESTTQDRASVLTVRGELDLATSPALEEELARALTQDRVDVVIVDLRELEFIDSTGLSVLVKAHQQAGEAGRRFGLVNGGSQVRRLLNLTGLADRLPVAEAPEELLSGG